MDRQQEMAAMPPRTVLEERANRDCLEHKSKHAERHIEILNCVVCLRKAVNAHMCPHCSKMGCENCLKEWVECRKGECPHCRKLLKPSELVNCSGLAREIQEVLVLTT